jgi:predicted phage terminase large subunit-like protein
MMNDQLYRRSLAFESFYWFFHIYFAHYAAYETAEFQQDLFVELQDARNKFLEILAFRGSAKSTIVTMAYAIWSIVGKPHKRYVVLIGDTMNQANQYLHNVKMELEENQLLKIDFGPFAPEGIPDDWRATSLFIKKYNARISAITDQQNVRGLREQEVRPDLIIADDLENTESVRQKEQRDKRYRWLKQDVMGVGDKNTRFILIGNLLHGDSLMMRVKREIETGAMEGKVLQYWITKDATNDGEPIWPGKFASREAIQAERKRIGDDRTWMREFLGKVVPEDGQEIKEEWIKRYNLKDLQGAQIIMTGIGVDLAISKKETADYTCMVTGDIYRWPDGTRKIVIRPNPIRERLSFRETIEQAKALVKLAIASTILFVEQVAYQQAAVEEMVREMLPVEPVKVTTDKRARLRTVSPYIQQGTVLFPETGCEDLLIELLGFGVEAHDDAVDALVHMLAGLIEKGLSDPGLPMFF